MVQRFRALGFSFTVTCAEPALAAELDRLLAPLARDDAGPAGRYAVDGDGGDPDGPYTIWFNGDRVCADASRDHAVAYLLWHVNQQAVASSSEWLLLHAAAATYGGQALVFPAASGRGKTTLVAGLTSRGFAYVTDDLVAVDMETGLVEPYWKPLSVKRGSWDALAALRPERGTATAAPSASEWAVSAADVGTGERPAACPVGFVIFPRYEAGAATSLTPRSPALSLLALSECSFNFAEHGRPAFELAGRLVEQAGCFDLVIGDLQAACDAVGRLVQEGGPA